MTTFYTYPEPAPSRKRLTQSDVAQSTWDSIREFSAPWDGTLRLAWSSETIVDIDPFERQSAPKSGSTLSPDGRLVATASADGKVRVSDAKSDTTRGVLWHGQPVESIEFSPDGKVIKTISGCAERLWDAHGTAAPLIELGGANPYSAISPDGTRLITLPWTGPPRLWDTRTGNLVTVLMDKTVAEQHPKFSALGTYATFDQRGTRLATVSNDNAVDIWNIESGELITRMDPHDGMLVSVDFSPDGRQLATLSMRGTARLWDAQNGTQRGVLDTHGGVSSIQFSSDGTRIFTSGAEFWLWDAGGGSALIQLPKHDPNSTWLGGDGSHIATLYTSGTGWDTVQLWDMHTGSKTSTLSGHHSEVRSVSFSPDGTKVLTGSFDNTARLWEVSTGKPLAILDHEGRVNTVQFSPDGRMMLTGSDDGSARLWDSRNGAPLASFVLDGPVMQAVFTRDGSRVLTNSAVEARSGRFVARLWDTKGSMVVELGTTNLLTHPQISADGNLVVTLYPDGSERFWKLPRLDPAGFSLYRSVTSDRKLSALEREDPPLTKPRAGAAEATTEPERCDELAGDPWDPGRKENGVYVITEPENAEAACRAAVREAPNEPRYAYLLGRVRTEAGGIEAGWIQYRKAADLDYAAAHYLLAWFLSGGYIATPDQAAIVRHLKRAMELGYVPAVSALANVIGDNSESFGLLERGASGGDPLCDFRLAEWYEHSATTAPDLDKVLYYYIDATRRFEDIRDYQDARVARWRRASVARSMSPKDVVRIARAAASE